MMWVLVIYLGMLCHCPQLVPMPDQESCERAAVELAKAEEQYYTDRPHIAAHYCIQVLK